MSDTLIINDILNAAAERKATDVHLVAGNNPVIRVDGRLVTLADQAILTGDILNTLAEVFLTKEDFDKLSKEKEVVAVYNWADRSRYRAKVFYQKGFLAISLRLISPFIRAPKDLGVPAALLQLLNREKGLIIITGPFGSGRTSTAASLVETLNQNKGIHIQTLEKPIEYLFSNNQSVIEQRSVGKDVNTFISGLKNMLDEDIDAVFVDCMHEVGMEELILELSESGKLIILVMDADSVISALERFISNISADKKEWGRDLLAHSLLGVVAQRLMPRVGGGLTMVSEVLVNIPAVRSSIKDDKLQQLNSIMQTSKQEGMVSLDKALLELVRVGEISLEDARNQAVDPQSLN
ncbi:MAG: Flp pilus assembly complex ATPase component TadA [Candidatus Komeilibacteria bacterium]|nr:Flp pilus assembly complex ATPase component TadA [Candidatus Komeilibacteria bacterium]